MDREIESVARAFYDVSGYSQPWDQASPVIKAQMRDDALTAIQSLDGYRGTGLIDDFLVALETSRCDNILRRMH